MDPLSVGRLSVRLSVCPISCPPTALPRVCCCAPGRQEMSTDCSTAGGQRQRRHSTALGSKCGQSHVYS